MEENRTHSHEVRLNAFIDVMLRFEKVFELVLDATNLQVPTKMLGTGIYYDLTILI